MPPTHNRKTWVRVPWGLPDLNMKCKKCKKKHDGSFGSGRYCSRFCANSRLHTEETKTKISKSLSKFYGGLSSDELRKRVPSPKQIEESIQKRKKTWNEKLLNEDFSTLKFERIGKRVKLEQEGKCNRCGLDTWQGESLTLELEHKDGNNKNNGRDNLEALCPNCHSLTKTWRGRNIRGSESSSVSDEDVVRAYLETGSIRQCLLKLGIAAKGSNYGRVKRALTLWGIEY